jgi:ABC-2 type transport system permease protein
MNGNMQHLQTLYRVEWKLFNRIKTNYVFALFVPIMLLGMMKYVQDQIDVHKYGLETGPLMVATTTGIFLIYTLYTSVTGLFVARREELVLKKLRTGEASDAVILAGGSSVYTTVALAQIVVLTIVISLMTGAMPKAPHLALLGVIGGGLLMLAMAAATAGLCRTVESVQIGILPVMFILPLITGVYFPLDVLPEMAQNILLFVPLTSTIDLVRSGWTAELSLAETLVRLLVMVGWTVIFARFAAKKFRWEPRT